MWQYAEEEPRRRSDFCWFKFSRCSARHCSRTTKRCALEFHFNLLHFAFFSRRFCALWKESNERTPWRIERAHETTAKRRTNRHSPCAILRILFFRLSPTLASFCTFSPRLLLSFDYNLWNEERTVKRLAAYNPLCDRDAKRRSFE